mmetsp:Transcript_70208/g.110923  ORF Transcript_70208/g.110923 Transcript_70208/m.110923 type:complete len:212 (+) Transcript_70208:3-638(+)
MLQHILLLSLTLLSSKSSPRSSRGDTNLKRRLRRVHLNESGKHNGLLGGIRQRKDYPALPIYVATSVRIIIIETWRFIFDRENHLFALCCLHCFLLCHVRGYCFCDYYVRQEIGSLHRADHPCENLHHADHPCESLHGRLFPAHENRPYESHHDRESHPDLESHLGRALSIGFCTHDSYFAALLGSYRELNFGNHQLGYYNQRPPTICLFL